jgi:hypothetical protein
MFLLIFFTLVLGAGTANGMPQHSPYEPWVVQPPASIPVYHPEQPGKYVPVIPPPGQPVPGPTEIPTIVGQKPGTNIAVGGTPPKTDINSQNLNETWAWNPQDRMNSYNEMGVMFFGSPFNTKEPLSCNRYEIPCDWHDAMECHTILTALCHESCDIDRRMNTASLLCQHQSCLVYGQTGALRPSVR